MRWTPEQDAYLVEHAHEGAEAVRKGMYRAFGIIRSVSAITSHGTRIGASWRRYEVCPCCGIEAERLNRSTGLCAACTWEARAARAEAMRRAAEDAETRERDAKRRYFRDMKAIERRGVSVKLHTNLPNSRSAGKEKLCTA